MSARPFTNPDFGREVRIEQHGREVHLIFVASTETKANVLVENILTQSVHFNCPQKSDSCAPLKGGALNLTMMGKPSSIKDPLSLTVTVPAPMIEAVQQERLLWEDDPADHPLVRAFRAERRDVVFLGFGGRIEDIRAALDRILEAANRETAENAKQS